MLRNRKDITANTIKKRKLIRNIFINKHKPIR